jgi:hypothetical protein
MQQVIACIVDKQELCARVAEMQLQLDHLLPKFCIEPFDNRWVFVLHSGDLDIGDFVLELRGWRCVDQPLQLMLDNVHLLMFDYYSPGTVQLHIIPMYFDQYFSRKTLPLLLQRLGALDVPELPDDSSAALHQFLQAAAHLLD